MLSDDVAEDLNIAVLTPVNTVNTAGFGSKPEVCPAFKAEIYVTEVDRSPDRAQISVERDLSPPIHEEVNIGQDMVLSLPDLVA